MAMLLIFGKVAWGQTTYYVALNASTNGNGSQSSPWNNFIVLNSMDLNPGDIINIAGDKEVTTGIFLDSNDSGTPTNPVIIQGTLGAGGIPASTIRIDVNDPSSDPEPNNPNVNCPTPERAVILLQNTAYIQVKNLNLIGNTSNLSDPSIVACLPNSSGLSIVYEENDAGSYTNSSVAQKLQGIKAENVYANGFKLAGIRVESRPYFTFFDGFNTFNPNNLSPSAPLALSGGGFDGLQILNCKCNNNFHAGIDILGKYELAMGGKYCISNILIKN
ncbi:MAG: hypothetical protein IPL35_12120 [Sphingobacteriales bacterium]|nr:hypothetical protein [Sphingobacteriales bacterium]